MDVLTLDIKGVVLALVIALIMLYFGYNTVGWPLGIFYVVSMLYFLAVAAIVTRIGARYKKRVRLYQQVRGIKNVLGNGLAPLIFAVAIYFFGGNLALVVGFISSVAAVTADKFGSEIGVLAGKPTSIVTFKKIEKGVSGGVTLTGLGAELLGAFLIAAILSLIYPYPILYNCQNGGCHNLIPLIPAIIAVATVAGFLGTIVDSYLGYFEEKGIGNKHTSNFLCGLAGGIIGALIFLLI